MYIREKVSKFRNMELIINNRQTCYLRAARPAASLLPPPKPSTTTTTTPTPTSNLPASIQPCVSTNPTLSQYHSHKNPGTCSNPNLMFILTAVLSVSNLMFWQRRRFREPPYVCRTFHQCCRGARLALLSLALLAPLQSEVTSA